MAAVSESRGLARDLLLYAAAVSSTGAVLRSGEEALYLMYRVFPGNLQKRN